MRCPKCGYISFDYNQVCPKCSKDISDEHSKLNLPSYKYGPPSLLGILTGTGNEANAGYELDPGSVMDASAMGLNFDGSSPVIEDNAADLGEAGEDIEINLDADDSGEFELPEITMDDSDGEKDSEEDLNLVMDDFSFDDSDEPVVSLGQDDLDLGIDTADDSAQDNEISGASPESLVEEDISMDDSLATDDVMDSFDDKSGEESLDLDELKVNETGELEINSYSDQINTGDATEEEEAEIEFEPSLGVDDLSMDDIADESLDLGDLAMEDIDRQLNEGDLELGEITMRESVEPDADEGNALELDTQSPDKDNAGDDVPSIDLDDLESLISGENSDDSLEFNLDKGSDDTEESKSKGAGAVDDDLVLDLENLDLDLDLDSDDSEKK